MTRFVYQKQGRQVRYEHGRVIRISERGEAVNYANIFDAQPLGGEVTLPDVDDAEVRRAAAEIGRMIAPPMRIERLILSDGIAEHAMKIPDRGPAEEENPPLWHRWLEYSRRLHLAVACGPLRIIFDRGDFDLRPFGAALDALGRAGSERAAPGRLRLAPPVAAALVPELVGVTPPNVQLWQTGGGRDGLGLPVKEQPIQGPPWPNWYRPSYRIRPVAMPMSLRAECSVTKIDRNLPVAVALLAPLDGLTLRVLCVDGQESFPTTVRLTRIDAIAAEREWYPYFAGAWGSEMML